MTRKEKQAEAYFKLAQLLITLAGFLVVSAAAYLAASFSSMSGMTSVILAMNSVNSTALLGAMAGYANSMGGLVLTTQKIESYLLYGWGVITFLAFIAWFYAYRLLLTDVKN